MPLFGLDGDIFYEEINASVLKSVFYRCTVYHKPSNPSNVSFEISGIFKNDLLVSAFEFSEHLSSLGHVSPP